MSNFCPSCGTELNGAKFCPNCGRAAAEPENLHGATAEASEGVAAAPIPEMAEPSVQAAVASLPDDSPIIHKKKKKGYLIAAIVVGLIAVISVPLLLNSALFNRRISQNDFCNISGLSNDQVKKVLDVLEQCGITDIFDMKHEDQLDTKGEKRYRLYTLAKDEILLYLLPDGSVSMVRYADNDLYAKGKVQATLNDFTLTAIGKSNFRGRSQELIMQILKSPSTARFPSTKEWEFSKNLEGVTARSYMYAENAFGEMVRSEFQITLTLDAYEATSLILDGKEYIK